VAKRNKERKNARPGRPRWRMAKESGNYYHGTWVYNQPGGCPRSLKKDIKMELA
jgi:hypothetical protein